MYRDDHLESKQNYNIVFDDGGLGDSIARLPAVKYVADTHKHVQVHLWVPDYFKPFAKNCLRDTNVVVRCFSEKDKYNTKYNTRCFSAHKYNNMAVHLTDHGFHLLVNKDPDIEHKNYLKPDLSRTDIEKFNLPEKYIVMTCGFTAPAREMYASTINEITAYVKEQGMGIVFLGQHVTRTGGKDIMGNFKPEIDLTVGLDLIDKTTLLEAAKIIGNSKGIVGLDNGLLHLAGATDVPIIGGFSNVEPRYRMPYRNSILGYNFYPVVPPETLKCRFCQSNWTFAKIDAHFIHCHYNDYQCLKELKSDLYIKELGNIL